MVGRNSQFERNLIATTRKQASGLNNHQAIRLFHRRNKATYVGGLAVASDQKRLLAAVCGTHRLLTVENNPSFIAKSLQLLHRGNNIRARQQLPTRDRPNFGSGRRLRHFLR